MLLKSVEYNNFQLFSKTVVNFNKINAVTGINLDSPEEDAGEIKYSANGAGKTTVGISGILFCLYGKVDGVNIADLLRQGEKKARVKTVWEDNGDEIIIIRNIPSSLSITINGKDFDGNTIALKERFINVNFGTYEDFRMFRTIDSEQGINLLSLGGTTLRKTLMSFIDDECSVWRKQVADIKNNREKFGIDKRPYKFYLSKKRLEILKSNQDKFESDIAEAKAEVNKQDVIISDIKIKISNINQKTETDKQRIEEYNKNIVDLQEKITDYENKLSSPIPEEKVALIDYETKIKETETILDSKEKELEEIKSEKEEINKNIQKINLEIKEAEGNINKYLDDINKLKIEIKALDEIESDSKCDKCGAKVTKENKEQFKKEKLDIIAVKEKCLEEIDEKVRDVKIIVDNLKESEVQKKNEERAVVKIISDLRLEISNSQNLKDRQNKVVFQTNIKIANLKSEKEKYQEYIKDSNSKIAEMRDKIQTTATNSNTGEKELFELEDKLEAETDYRDVFYNNITVLESKQKITKEYLFKLTEAFKFENYKYTPKDIEICQEAIRTIDGFSGWFIEEWLKNLEIIINDLLSKISLSIKFLSSKDFIEVNDNGKLFKYGQLSAGQKTFLNSVFKLALLLNKSQNDGIMLCDEGLSNMDSVNLKKFISVCNNTNIQIIFIYQNCPQIENVNYINVIRQNGESRIE